MKPEVTIRKTIIARYDLYSVLSEARGAMIRVALAEAVRQKKSITDRRLARDDAELRALKMCRRCMKVGTFEEGMEIVKDYVDIVLI